MGASLISFGVGNGYPRRMSQTCTEGRLPQVGVPGSDSSLRLGVPAPAALSQFDTASFDLNQGSVAERSDRWETALARVYVTMSVRVAPLGSRTTTTDFLRHRDLHDLALVDMRCGPCSAARTKSGVSADREDYMAVLIGLEGHEKVAVDDTHGTLMTGGIALWDSARSARFDVPDGISKRTLLVPRRSLAASIGPSRSVEQISLRGAGARMLSGYLDVLCGTLDELTQEEVLAARNATLELLSGLLRAEGSSIPWGAAPAVRTQIDRWLDTNLLGEITPASAAAANAISVRTLHRLFTESGKTFVTEVRARRLARAREDLLHTDQSVASIASRWRFTDASHFTRVFRIQFGMPPGAYRTSFRAEGNGAGTN